MGYTRRDVILVLLLLSSLGVGQLMVVATAPIHEFGHYVVGKHFGWNITEIDWYSHVEFTEETIDNAPRMQKIFVNVAGVILVPIIPYIISTRKKSTILEAVTLPYFGLGFAGSSADLKFMYWNLFIGNPTPVAEFKVLGPANLMASVLVVLTMLGVANKIIRRYKRCLTNLSVMIDNLDDVEVSRSGL